EKCLLTLSQANKNRFYFPLKI
ncbi:hypothetical protein CP8484711_1238B, partial [Chlamydia psittaci 84-8471/1]